MFSCFSESAVDIKKNMTSYRRSYIECFFCFSNIAVDIKKYLTSYCESHIECVLLSVTKLWILKSI